MKSGFGKGVIFVLAVNVKDAILKFLLSMEFLTMGPRKQHQVLWWILLLLKRAERTALPRAIKVSTGRAISIATELSDKPLNSDCIT